MIKIIKPGKRMVATCPNCECEFSYEDENIEWGDQRDPYKEVVCPCCTNRIDLNVYKRNQYDILIGFKHCKRESNDSGIGRSE